MLLPSLRLLSSAALLTALTAAPPAFAADPTPEKTEGTSEATAGAKTGDPTLILGGSVSASAVLAPPPRRVEAPYVGLCAEPLTLAQGEKCRLAPGTGLCVLAIAPNSPSAAAGLARQDVLLKLDGQILINPAQLRVLVRLRKAGEPAVFEILRQGKPMTVKVQPVLQSMPELTPGGEESRVIYGARGQGPTRTFRIAPGEQPIPPEILKDMPPELRAKIERMNKENGASGHVIMGSAPLAPADGTAPAACIPSRVTARDARHTTVVEHGKREHLCVTDNQDGQTLYDGPIPTDDQGWEKVPADVRAKAKILSGQAAPRPRSSTAQPPAPAPQK